MINGDLCHELLLKNITPKLSFDEKKDDETRRKEIREKFISLTGLDKIAENATDPNFEVIFKEDKGNYFLTRFEFSSEVGERVPCYLLTPKTKGNGTKTKKFPVAITLQGHVSGFHNSVGVAKYPADFDGGLERRSMALQAVENGYVALAIEQRGMGERKPTLKKRGADVNCRFASFVAISMGRTLIGERVWDVSKAIDMLSNFPECDTDKIIITGNSGGGTTSYYAACFDERIKICAPSCAFCPYKSSVLDILHCECNQIPQAINYFEMQDLSELICPRELIIIAGEKDDIFPIEGVKEGYKTVEKIYGHYNAGSNCRLKITPKEHWWCTDIVWNAIGEAVKKLWFK